MSYKVSTSKVSHIEGVGTLKVNISEENKASQTNSLKIKIIKDNPLSSLGSLDVDSTQVIILPNVSIYDVQVNADKTEVRELTQEVRDAHKCIHEDKDVVRSDRGIVYHDKTATHNLKKETEALLAEVKVEHEHIHDDKAVVAADKLKVAQDKEATAGYKDHAKASMDEATKQAGIASTKASEASQSASNALTQANRAEDEADRAQAIADNLQLEGGVINGNLSVSGVISEDGTLLSDKYAAITYVDQEIANLKGGVGSAYDTLKEIADELQQNENEIGSITTALGTKVSKSGDTMTGDLYIAGIRGNLTPPADQIKLDGYGVIGNRAALYFTNSNEEGNIQIGVGGAHSANAKLMITKSRSTFHSPVYTTVAQPSDGGSLTRKDYVDGAFVKKSGDTMTGMLGALGFRVMRREAATGQDDNVTLTCDDAGLIFTNNNDADGDSSTYTFGAMINNTFTKSLQFNNNGLTFKDHDIYHAGNKPTWIDVGGDGYISTIDSHLLVGSGKWLRCADGTGFLPNTNNNGYLGQDSWRFREAWINTYRGGSINVTGNISGDKGLFQSENPSTQLHLKRTNLEQNVGICFETVDKVKYFGMNSDGNLAYGDDTDQNQNHTFYHEGYETTPAKIGALPLIGGELSGDLIINGNQKHLKFKHTAHNSGDIIWEWDNEGVIEQQGRIWSINPGNFCISSSNSTTQDGAGVLYFNEENEITIGGNTLYHTGNLSVIDCGTF